MLGSGSLPQLSSERLELRPVNAADIGALIELNGDPDVMTYIRGRASTPAETKAEWRQRLNHQSKPALGLGYWLGFEAGVFVGWWSASWFAQRPELSGIGYRLRASAWGRGLATEGARAMIAQAFAAPSIASVFASTMAVNSGSRRVLEKVGMTHTDTRSQVRGESIPGSEHGEVHYELSRAAWARGDPGPLRSVGGR
jgi:RimJ/RimL family protein N-acetyltransferase